MFLIDRIAYRSPLRTVHPMEKFIFSSVSMVLVLLSRGPAVPLALFAVMGILITVKARVRVRDYLKLLTVPLFFIFISVVTLIVTTGPGEGEFIVSAEAAGIRFGITGVSLAEGIKILLRSVSSISCFYFFILTTPLVDLDYILIRLRVPAYFREIFILVYRFIFIIFEMWRNIYLSQRSRSGYAGLARAYRSTGALMSSVLVKSLSFGEKSHQALLSRGYTGEFRVLRKKI